MKRLDLDDLPPKVASLLSGLAAGEELLLVQCGAVAGRLTAVDTPPAAPPPEPGEASPHEIFEQFRSAVEDEF